MDIFTSKVFNKFKIFKYTFILKRKNASMESEINILKIKFLNLTDLYKIEYR
ncbi:hypothetical protein LEP1GSC127_2783 [Leptospira kirschneri str. 200801925]|nr:hypothetical protein LEP1GSC127_2783 [Leptospira kirschneri str. 200801925]